jgi:hypothetical protein
MLESTDINVQNPKFEPVTLIHTYSETEYYIGVSNNGHDTSREIWQIKKMSKVGDVWYVTQFPNGSQLFNYVWDNRLIYTYI